MKFHHLTVWSPAMCPAADFTFLDTLSVTSRDVYFDRVVVPVWQPGVLQDCERFLTARMRAAWSLRARYEVWAALAKESWDYTKDPAYWRDLQWQLEAAAARRGL